VRVESLHLKKIHAVSKDLDSPLRCIDAAVQEKMKAEVDAVLKAGDTVGEFLNCRTQCAGGTGQPRAVGRKAGWTGWAALMSCSGEAVEIGGCDSGGRWERSAG